MKTQHPHDLHQAARLLAAALVSSVYHVGFEPEPRKMAEFLTTEEPEPHLERLGDELLSELVTRLKKGGNSQ